MLGRFPQEARSAHACAVQTRIRPVHFFTFVAKVLCLTAPKPCFLPPSPASPNFARTPSALACTVQTHFRPLLCGVFLKPSSAKCDALLRLGHALLRLRPTLAISAGKALRPRLCNPNKLYRCLDVTNLCTSVQSGTNIKSPTALEATRLGTKTL